MQRPWNWNLGTMLGAAALLAGGLVLTGCPAPSGAPINTAPGLVAEYVAVQADHPFAVAASDDVNDPRVFYTEKNTGQIRVIKSGALLDTPYATVPVNFAGARGLLGIALHPDFTTNGRVYVCYTRSDVGEATNNPDAFIDQRIVYFNSTGDVASSGEIFVASLPVVEQAQLGGFIAFGPDGKLYVGAGDQTSIDTPQDPTSLLGKILRFNDDGTIPSDNPDPNSAVYASGVREPRGFAFDAGGDGWFIDRAPNGLDEINRLQARANYGWPDIAGVAGPADQDYLDANPNYADPTLTVRLGLSGAAFNPSSKYGAASEGNLFAGTSAGEVWRFPLSSDRTGISSSARIAHALPGPVTDVAFTPAGTLYLGADSGVLRVTRFELP